MKKFLILILSLSLIGCATITRGSKQEVYINTEPEGALVNINGMKGITPFKTRLSTSREYLIDVIKDGYVSQQIYLTREFSVGRSIAGNILWLGIGLIVDLSTGAAYTLEPDSTNIILEKINEK